MRSPNALAHALCGTSVAICVFVRAMRDFDFKLHPAPLVYQRRHPSPMPEPSRVGSSAYHPVVVLPGSLSMQIIYSSLPPLPLP
jgi:hypothetical protein